MRFKPDGEEEKRGVEVLLKTVDFQLFIRPKSIEQRKKKFETFSLIEFLINKGQRLLLRLEFKRKKGKIAVRLEPVGHDPQRKLIDHHRTGYFLLPIIYYTFLIFFIFPIARFL